MKRPWLFTISDHPSLPVIFPIKFPTFSPNPPGFPRAENPISPGRLQVSESVYALGPGEGRVADGASSVIASKAGESMVNRGDIMVNITVDMG